MTVKIVEVGLRDGLQNETQIYPTSVKIKLLNKLLAANITEIEVTSLVHPKWIPQLADAEQLLAQLPQTQQANFRALVPNVRGLERMQDTPISEIAVFISASPSHNQKNGNKSIVESLAQISDIMQLVKAKPLAVRAYISCVFGCPYEGDVSLQVVDQLCDTLLQMGIYEISLGDTIGVAVPKQVQHVIQSLQSAYGGKLAVHFHDTNGLALVNAYVAWENGITAFDSSIGGLGGCPYAPGASGNVATEELVTLFHGLGVETGIDIEKLCQAAAWMENQRNKPLPSKVLRQYAASKRM
jgi:hydroxymethylglutaryl-CoA lyase